MYEHDYLIHFNPYHDKLGRFSSRNGVNFSYTHNDYKKTNNIYNTLTDDEKKKITAEDIAPKEFTNKEEYESYIHVYDAVLNVKNIPVSVVDIWKGGDKSHVNLSVMTRGGKSYRGKGYANQVVKYGMRYIKKHPEILSVGWGVHKDNQSSINLAIKNGFKYKHDIDDEWEYYEYKKR